MVRIQSSANFYKEHLFSVNCIDKTQVKKKTPGMAFKKHYCRGMYVLKSCISFWGKEFAFIALDDYSIIASSKEAKGQCD